MLSVFDPAFSAYGKVLDGLDTAPLLETLIRTTEKPLDKVIYIPSDETLESLDIFVKLRDNVYGGMPIQLGYCNGSNRTLNCLEYHRDSEVNVAAEDIVLLLATLPEVKAGKLDTSAVKAFLAPKGAAVQLYETTLHYAPCNGPGEAGFRVVVVLPRGTNTDKPEIEVGSLEDQLLWAKNKWLMAHPDSGEAKAGAFVGLTGDNITLNM